MAVTYFLLMLCILFLRGVHPTIVPLHIPAAGGGGGGGGGAILGRHVQEGRTGCRDSHGTYRPYVTLREVPLCSAPKQAPQILEILSSLGKKLTSTKVHYLIGPGGGGYIVSFLRIVVSLTVDQ